MKNKIIFFLISVIILGVSFYAIEKVFAANPDAAAAAAKPKVADTKNSCTVVKSEEEKEEVKTKKNACTEIGDVAEELENKEKHWTTKNVN
jgi:hypothetical protein